jgi:hypothetical protein
MEANGFVFSRDEIDDILEYLKDNTIKCSLCGGKAWEVQHDRNEQENNKIDFKLQCASPNCPQFMSRGVLKVTTTSIEEEVMAEMQSQESFKSDAGKVHAGILNEFKRALMEIAKVGTAGLNKGYARGSWRTLPDAKERYLDAFWRHILAVEEINEADGGVYHLAQVAWNAMALLELRLEDKEEGLYID